MVNEFLKSIIRTLGRIFAYILIGFLLFIMFGKVYAQDYDFNRFRYESIKTNWNIGNTKYANKNVIAYDVNTSTTPPTIGSNMGWQWYPVDNSNNYLGINQGAYSIDIWWRYYSPQPMYKGFPPHFFIAVYNGSTWIEATCDGNVSFAQYETGSGATDYGTYNFYTYQYNCSKLVVNSNFQRLRIRAYFDGIPNSPPLGIVTYGVTFLDVSNIQSDSQAIMNNDNINTTNIINNQNTNTQTITNNATQNSQNEVNAINNVNSSINSSSVDNPSNAFNGFNNSLASEQGIQTIFLLPITLIQSILNSLNSTSCSTINFGSLLGTNLTLTCIDLSSILGSSFYNLLDLICCFGIIFGIRKYVIEIFEKITSLKEDNLND